MAAKNNIKRKYQKVEVTIEKTFVIEWHDSSSKNEARKQVYDHLWSIMLKQWSSSGVDPIKKMIQKSKTKVTTIKKH